MIKCQRHVENVFLSATFILACNFFITYGAHWSAWTDWKVCSVTCGRGFRSRYRTCEHSDSTSDQQSCEGEFVDSIICDTNLECPVNGGWNEWSRWTPCSVTCGQGIVERKRACDNPAPAAGGQDCKGPRVESQACFDVMQHCPRDGKWSRWGEWSQCSVTCGKGGTRRRNRECNSPPPAKDGRNCEGLPYSQQSCQAKIECPVNGHWSEWSNWTECTTSCGAGEKQRWRRCDDPAPQFGGEDCDRTEAGEVQIESCNGEYHECPVDGGWSDWSEMGKCYKANCSSRLDFAYMMQQRSCNSPTPSGGGQMCQGIFINAAICFNPINCRVNGGWSEWSDWTCTVDMVTRNRTCDNPAPANGGRPCQEPGKAEHLEFLHREDFPELFREHCPHMVDKVVTGEEEDDGLVDGSGGDFGSDQEHGPEEGEEEEE